MATAQPDLRSRRRFLGASSPSDTTTPLRHWVRAERRAMACRFEVTIDERDAAWLPLAQAALTEVEAIEAQLTVFRDTSAIADLNRRAAAADVPCDADVFDLLSRCAALWRHTDGAFDITSTPLSRSWGFMRREGRLPHDHEIAAARAIVGMHHVQLDAVRSTVRFLNAGIELNLGAVGKGYALDRIAASLRGAGVERALISAGQSSTIAMGSKAGWPIDLVSPRRDKPLARVWLQDAALGTSGAGTQFVMVDGKRYGHVIDPRTGWPADGILSATVIGPSAADADALSTAFLIGGPLLAQRYCEQHAGVLALLTPDDDSDQTLVIGHCAQATVEDL